MSGEPAKMNATLSAAKQQLRSAMKQRLAALSQSAINEQSTSPIRPPPYPQHDGWQR